MPLHKSGRAHRLDPTMISAPLGDFRHTMHIGRGGDAFGDTSFLSSHGPSNTESSKSVSSPVADINSTETALNCDGGSMASEETTEPLPELRHSESVSSFDLDLDLGPSILGDVLGVMDGLGLGSKSGLEGGEEVFSSSKGAGGGGMSPTGMAYDLRVQRPESLSRGEENLNEINGVKSKGLRPKVRFSDKKEEIIGRQYASYGSESEREEEICTSPGESMQMRGEEITNKEVIKPETTNHQANNSPSSSMSSEYEGVSPLDRRREEDRLSESGSEEEGVAGEQGYTFEDESDDEIGL